MKDITRPELKPIKPYRPGKPIAEVKRELGLKKVVKLASNESPWPPFPQAIKAIEEAAAKLNRYPDSSSYLLKEKLSSFYGVDSSLIAIGNGSNELIRLIANALLNPGDDVIYAWPSFVVYPTVTMLMQANSVQVPLNNFTHDLKNMKEKITSRTKIIFICNPNNPTGTIVSRKEIDDFLQNIPQDILVVFDEAYYEYVQNDAYPESLDYIGGQNQIAILRTFSKIFGLAGCRIGYGIMPDYLVEVINKAREPFNVNRLAQAAALASLDQPQIVKERHLKNIEQKEIFYRELSKMGLNYVPTEANFILIDVGRDVKDIFEKLLKEGVITRTGDIFGYPTHLRVTFGDEDENKFFFDKLKLVLNL